MAQQYPQTKQQEPPQMPQIKLNSTLQHRYRSMLLRHFTRFFRSVSFALQGIRTFYSTQYNAKIHLGFTMGVTAAGFFFGLSRTDWILLTLTVGLVWMAEAFNTALEFLTDLASPDYHPLAKKAKDVAAGAVLLASIAAVVVGLLIFVPAVRAWLGV